MKHLQITFMLTVLMSMVGTKASAYDIAVENSDGKIICYNYINDGTELEVTSGRGYSGGVNIPETVTYMNRTRRVTTIGSSAFSRCSSLNSVTIPNSVTTIGSSAFRECSNLTSVTIPNSVTSIGESAFYDCSGLKKVIVKDISAWCNIKFGSNPLYYAHHLYSDENTEITDLVIPNSVTSIGYDAFSGCSGLTSVEIPNSVTSIGSGAFYDCSGLKKVIVKDISAWCNIKFSNSYSNPLPYAHHLYSDEYTEIKDLTIPNSVTSIGGSAFRECSGLTSVTIPNSVTSIGSSAFSSNDIPTVISLIENPFAINSNVFSQNTRMNATLYIPKGTIDKYKAKAGWKDFMFIEEGTGGGETPTVQKCEKPTISYKNGKLTFKCATAGAVCQSSITDTDIKSYSGNEIQLGVTYNISVYATKTGYENSETATATLCWIDVEPKADGIDNGVAQVRSNAVLIQSNDGVVTVSGVDDGKDVTVYSVDGQMVSSAKVRDN